MVWVEDVLRFRDTDKNGHINNSVFSVLCESGRVNLFGLKFDPLLRPGTFYVIARLVIDFRAELHYPGRVNTATWLNRVGRSSMGLKQAIVSEARHVLLEGSRRIAAEVGNSLDFHRMQGGDGMVARAVLTGPVAAIPGFDVSLSSALGLPVTVGVMDGAPAGIEPGRVTVAAGLAVEEVSA